MKRPKKSEYPEFLETYIGKVPPRGNALFHLKKAWKEAVDLFKNLPEEKGNFRYAEGKWTVKQLLQHLIDAERVFAFRACWFMRGDRAPLPGFNQDNWMEQVNVDNRTIADLMKEWKAVRENTLFLAQHCSEEQSKFLGTASGWKSSTRAFFYIILGHQYHHIAVLREKYLPAA